MLLCLRRKQRQCKPQHSGPKKLLTSHRTAYMQARWHLERASKGLPCSPFACKVPCTWRSSPFMLLHTSP